MIPKTISHLLLITLLPVMAFSCTSQKGLIPSLQVVNLNGDQASENLQVHGFYRICLSENASEAKRYDLATLEGFSEASDKDLQSLGLSPIRKTVFEIPGGGARVSESQKLLFHDGDVGSLLSLEQHKEQKRLVSSSCKLYSADEDHLKMCETLGRVIGRAPDTNKKYKASNAHFINWHVSLNSKRVRISCENPGSSALPEFAGSILSVTYLNL